MRPRGPPPPLPTHGYSPTYITGATVHPAIFITVHESSTISSTRIKMYSLAQLAIVLLHGISYCKLSKT
eukprot:796292-Karenia_brevis.AAC.1